MEKFKDHVISIIVGALPFAFMGILIYFAITNEAFGAFIDVAVGYIWLMLGVMFCLLVFWVIGHELRGKNDKKDETIDPI